MLLMRRCRRRWTGIVAGMRHVLRGCLWVRPAVATHAAGVSGDLRRSRAPLLAENALLRQQLLVLRRSVKRPVVTPADRACRRRTAMAGPSPIRVLFLCTQNAARS